MQMTKMDHTQEGERKGMDLQSLQYVGSLWSMLSPWKILVFVLLIPSGPIHQASQSLLFLQYGDSSDAYDNEKQI